MRFKDAMLTERLKESKEKKLPKKEQEMKDAMQEIKREMNTNDRIRKVVRK